MRDISVTLEDENEEELADADFKLLREWRASGDGESLDGVRGDSLIGVEPVLVLSCVERVSAVLRADGPFGVSGVPELDDEDGGRGRFFCADVVVVFISFVGRVGEPFL
jgi:hypothetical protein